MQYKAGSSRTPQPTDAQEDDSDNTVSIGGATGPTVLTCKDGPSCYISRSVRRRVSQCFDLEQIGRTAPDIS